MCVYDNFLIDYFIVQVVRFALYVVVLRRLSDGKNLFKIYYLLSQVILLKCHGKSCCVKLESMHAQSFPARYVYDFLRIVTK